jgi:GTP cyclohydrolase I
MPIQNGEKESVYRAAGLLDGKEIDLKTIEESTRNILVSFGEDPDREGLLRTPDRVSKMYIELLAGYRTDPFEMLNDALFEIQYDEMVIVRDIEFYSLCEHHMLPFVGRAHVAYMPKGRVIGLSTGCGYVRPPVTGTGTDDNANREFSS